MRNENPCPKCGGSRAVRIPGQTGAYGAGSNVSTGWTVFSSVPVDRYLCLRCGYVEHWVTSREGIERIEAAFAAREGAPIIPPPESSLDGGEEVCLSCGASMPEDAAVCSTCGWSYR